MVGFVKPLCESFHGTFRYAPKTSLPVCCVPGDGGYFFDGMRFRKACCAWVSAGEGMRVPETRRRVGAAHFSTLVSKEPMLKPASEPA